MFQNELDMSRCRKCRKVFIMKNGCLSCAAYDSDREGCTLPSCDTYACSLESDNEFELNEEDISFDEFESVLGSKIYCTFFDWFVDHCDDGTPFPDVRRLYAADLLEYEKRGGVPLQFVGTTLCRAFITSVIS